MAAGYRYKILDESNEEINDGHQHRKPGCLCHSKLAAFFFICLLFMALLILFLVVLMGYLGFGFQHSDCDDPKYGCLSPGCVKTSSDILSKMDLEVDPCTDMYHYACGGWIKENSVPPGQYKINMFSEASEKNEVFLRKFLEHGSIEFRGRNMTSLSKLKTAYRSCMDKDSIERVGVQPLVEVINTLGSWTVVQGGVNNINKWDGDQWVLQDTLVAGNNLGSTAFFDYGIPIDSKKTSRRLPLFKQAGLTLTYPGAYTDRNSQKFEAGFLEYATQVAVLLGGDPEVSRKKMKEVYNFEKELSEIFIPRSEMTNPLDIYNKMTLKEFQNIIGPWIDLKSYLQGTFRGHQFTDEQEVIISTPSYFKNLSSIIQNTDKEILANYMMWTTLQKFIYFMPESFLQATLLLSKSQTGISELPPRWKLCVSFAKGGLGFAASSVYVDAKFSASDKEKVEKTIENIRENFISNLASVQWLDDVTRSRLREKAEAVLFNIGYPDWILDPEQLDEFYDKFITPATRYGRYRSKVSGLRVFAKSDLIHKLVISNVRSIEGKLELKDDEFLKNRITLNDFGIDKTVEKYGKKPDRLEWDIFPIEVNAFYTSTLNRIMLPAGILQPPFFSSYFPKSFLYATIGVAVGHEFTHAFDNSGRMFDKDGNLGKQQWTTDTSRLYRDHAKCMEEQYSEYSLQGVHVNGKTTLNENIADNGAVRLAYNAFLKDKHKETITLPALNLSANQMYFLGYAQIMCAIFTPEYEIDSISTDEHTYPMYRVKGVYQNMPEFLDVFKCRKDQVEKPIHKVCRVW